MTKSTQLRLVLLMLAVAGLVIVFYLLNYAPSTNDQQAGLHVDGRQAITPTDTKATIDNANEATTPRRLTNSQFAESLSGTEIDGQLKSTREGELVLDLSVRDFFDYFLSASDEIGPEQAVAEIKAHINDYLPEPAASEARALLEKYLRFKRYEYQIQQTPVNTSQLGDADALALLRNAFENLKQKRGELFSANENQALFGLEDQYSSFTLNTLELMADESLSDEQKHQSLALLRSNLPAQLQQSINQTESQKEQQKDIEQLLSSQHDSSQTHEILVSKGLSDQKADEVVAYQQRQAAFERQYSEFQSAQSSLSPDLSADDRGDQIEALRRQYFITPESSSRSKLRDLEKAP